MSEPIIDLRVQRDGTLLDVITGTLATIVGNGGVLPNTRKASVLRAGMRGFVADFTSAVSVSFPSTGMSSTTGTILVVGQLQGGATVRRYASWFGSSTDRVQVYEGSSVAGIVVSNSAGNVVSVAPSVSGMRVFGGTWGSPVQGYIDGAASTPGSLNVKQTANGLLYIGSRDGTAEHCMAPIHRVLVYDTALTPQQVADVTNSIAYGPPAFTTGLRELFQRADAPLVTPTHDGSGQATHPSVIDFLTEHGMATWAGHRYWMAMTPFPNGNDEHEDPNLLCSDDGVTWVVPSGIVNPLRDGGGTTFHSDTDLVYDPDFDHLLVYFRESTDAGQTTHLVATVTSEMAVTISNLRIGSSGSWANWIHPTSSGTERSMSVVRLSAGDWRCWTNKTDGTRDIMVYHTSVNGRDWSVGTDCVDVFDDVWPGWYCWHQAAKRVGGRFEFLCSMKNPDFPDELFLALAHATDGSPTSIRPTSAAVALAPDQSTDFDGMAVYRSAFVAEVLPTGSIFYRVWYGGIARGWVCRLGYTQGSPSAVRVEPVGSGEANGRFYRTTTGASVVTFSVHDPDTGAQTVAPAAATLVATTATLRHYSADVTPPCQVRWYEDGVLVDTALVVNPTTLDPAERALIVSAVAAEIDDTNPKPGFVRVTSLTYGELLPGTMLYAYFKTDTAEDNPVVDPVTVASNGSWYIDLPEGDDYVLVGKLSRYSTVRVEVSV